LALRSELEAYRAARPPELFWAKLARRPKRAPSTSWLRWAVLLPVAVVLGLFVARSMGRSVGGDLRLMGAPFAATVLRARTGALEPLVDEQRVERGDRLRFTFDAPRAGQLLVLELDGRETVSVVYPPQGTRSAAVGAGPQVLEGAWELSAPASPEWFIAVFGEQPLDAPALAEQLRGQATRPRLELHCDGCRWHTLRFTADGP
jgi:hypothetical protein